MKNMIQYNRIYHMGLDYIADMVKNRSKAALDAYNEFIQQYDEDEFPEVMADELYKELWWRFP